ALVMSEQQSKPHFLPEISDLAEVIDKCLKKDRVDRYETALELLNALKSHRGNGTLTTGRFSGALSESSTFPPAENRDTSLLSYISSRVKAHKAVSVLFLILLLSLSYLALKKYSQKSSGVFQKVTLKNIPGTDNSSLVAISPDGRYVAYINEKNGEQSLWL